MSMNFLKNYCSIFAIAMISVMLLASNACSTSQLSVSLTVVSDATEAATLAVPTLEASGVLQIGVGNIILAYTGAVSTAAAQSAVELQSADTAAIKGQKIIGYFSSLVVPALGANATPEVNAILNAITSAVNLFLSQFNSPSALKAARSGDLDQLKLSSGDRRALGGLQRKFTATAAKCAALIKK